MIFLYAGNIQAQTYTGNITLTTQAHVDAFNYTEVTGSISVWQGADITNLDGLSELETIGGSLTIYQCPVITNINGLSNLGNVGNSVSIRGNPLLTDVDGLSSLTTISGDLYLLSNDAMTHVNMPNLTTLAGYLWFDESHDVTYIDLSGVSGTVDRIQISRSTALERVDMSSVSTVTQFVSIFFNTEENVLNSVDFASLTSVGTSMGLSRVPFLSTLNTPQLSRVDGYLRLSQTNLSSINMPSLTTIGEHLQVWYCNSLTDLDGLSTLTSVGGYLSITNNDVLSDCCGIHDLLQNGGVTGSISIRFNQTGCDSQSQITENCSTQNQDQDGDGVNDDQDNCPTTANADQLDTDQDGEGDVCDTDDDNDGVNDEEDAFPLDSSETTDTDGDGTGDNADQDDDNDGCLDADDANPLAASADSDGDGTADDCDICPNDADNDIDQDGICGDVDNCPTTYNPGQEDTDGDGAGDVCAPSWTVSQTGDSHVMVIATEGFTSNLGDGQTLEAGDQIGAFYDDNGESRCAGRTEWTGQNIAFTVYGDDLETDSIKEGFSEGEVMQWRVWDAETNEEQDVVATYETSDDLFTEGGEFSTNGVSQITSLSTAETQTITLQPGWNLISSYIEPSDADMAKVFEAVSDQVSIVKDETGTTYIPSSAINNIGDWDKVEGYQVRVSGSSPIDLEISGTKVALASTSIPLSRGWNLLPYLRESEQDIAVALNPIVSDVHIVKDIDGQIYMPSFGINNIGNMQAGRAYWVKMKADARLNYTARMAAPPAKMHSSQLNPTQYNIHRQGIYNATMILDTKGLIAYGDEIGVFDQAGNLVGAAIYEDHILAFSIWGDDPTTKGKDGLKEGGRFEIRAWNKAEGKETVFAFTANVEAYSTNEVIEAELLRTTKVVSLVDENSLNLYPNPTKGNTTLKLALTAQAKVEISIFDIAGNLIMNVAQEEMAAGSHELHINTAKLPSGLYHCRILVDGVIHNMPLSVVK